MNSIDLDVKGGKTITFKDGGCIKYTPHQDKFHNSLWGTLVHCLTGTCDFTDEQNGITATYTIGIKKGRDYFKGEIKKDGKVVSTLTGTYMGYIEWDGERWWDIRSCGTAPRPRARRKSPRRRCRSLARPCARGSPSTRQCRGRRCRRGRYTHTGQ